MANPPYRTIKRPGGELHVWGNTPRPNTNVHPDSRRVFVPTPKKPVASINRPAAPAAPGAPAPAPAAAPAAPVTGASPVDPAYDKQMKALDLQREGRLGDLTGQRTQGLVNYGYSEGANNQPVFDPTNPFSKASLLKSSYDASRRRSGQQMASGGQLYSGAYQTAQDSANRGQLQAEDTLQKSLTEFLAGNTASVKQAGTDYDTGAAAAESDRMARIPSNVLYEPTATEPDVQAAQAQVAAPAAPGYTTRRGKSKAGVSGTWHEYPGGRKVFIADK